ncbi:MAG: TRAP transporter small permease, partial [Burkholderiales bacterium]
MHSPQSKEGAVPAASSTSIFTRIERAIGFATAGVAGTLVVVETLLLFAGVLARYVYRKPLVWSDELASILFLWLAMLGAVIAYQKSEHMRMSALVNRAQPARRAFFEAFALVTGVVFLALVVGPAIEYAIDEIMVVTPALEIPNVWRASALPVG